MLIINAWWSGLCLAREYYANFNQIALINI